MSELWKLDIEKNIATLWFDTPEKSVNTLSSTALLELRTHLSNLPQGLQAVVLRSTKAKCFIAGADIEEFTTFSAAEDAERLIELGQSVCQELEDLPIVTIAVVDGSCLGGGYELALAADYIIATDENHTKVGLPEVMLGIHPGFGGSVRSIARVGVLKAMPLMLTGRPYSAKQAKRLGLIDACVPKRHLEAAVSDFIQRTPEKQRPALWEKLLNTSPIRLLVSFYLTRELKKKANPTHYPAPFALVDVWKCSGGKTTEMMQKEKESVIDLAIHPSSRGLVEVFFMQTALKGLGKGADISSIQHVHVVGAGVMGGDIAAWCALKGLRVTLQDTSLDAISRAQMRAGKLFWRKLKRSHLVLAAKSRLIGDPGGNGIAHADVIIEAIVESLEVKQNLFKTLEKNAKKTAILASNTSSIPLEEIAEPLKDKSRLIGLHFFNPVAKMQLVEVVSAIDSNQEILTLANAFVSRLGKLPLPVKSAPGFLVNRLLMPYLLEAVLLAEEGVSIEKIDQAALDFGMPMGPVTLGDVVGLDICHHVTEVLHGKSAIPKTLEEKVSRGELGVKTGQGFYTHKKNRPFKPSATLEEKERLYLQDRLFLPLFNEAVAALDEHVVHSENDLDAGMIFGSGFAPFTAGPMHVVKQRGKEELKAKLVEFAQTVGERYQPVDAWNNKP